MGGLHKSTGSNYPLTNGKRSTNTHPSFFLLSCCIREGIVSSQFSTLCVTSFLHQLSFSHVLLFFLLTIYLKPIHSVGFPRSSAGKEAACNAGDPGWIPGSGRSAGQGIGYPLQYSQASLVAQTVKNPPTGFDPWVGKIPWRREWQPTHFSWENPHGQRSLADYCSLGSQGVEHD